MARYFFSAAVVFLCAVPAARAAEQSPTTAPAAPATTRSLVLLAKDEHPDIHHVEIRGERPELIYIPITHDNPEHRNAAGGTQAIEQMLVRCQTISEHLYDNYGVRNILLEGLSRTLSDKYNSPKNRGRKLSVGKSRLVIWKVWFDLLNKNRWNLVPAYDKKRHGPVTLLGAEYTRRIYQALDTAKQNGWFRSREAFVANQAAFNKGMAEACKGYNARLDALISKDPGLKNEYDITVAQRNKVFIDNAVAAKGRDIVMCGGGHIQDLIDQLDKRKIAYMIIIPKGLPWPPPEKDDETIYRDMLKLGCQLKKCTLQFGDGTKAQVGLPIK